MMVLAVPLESKRTEDTIILRLL